VWTKITPAGFTSDISEVFASSTVPGLYGVTFNAKVAVTANGNAASAVWVTSNALAMPISSMAFPTTADSSARGKEYLLASRSELTTSGMPISDTLGHLFKTTDSGMTFQSLHGNGSGADLPNVPIAVVRYDPSDPTNRTLYVGNRLGAYQTKDGGDTWQRLGKGLPNVPVTDLFVAKRADLIRVSTFGRGLWELAPLPH
jgi:hypothetical protein